MPAQVKTSNSKNLFFISLDSYLSRNAEIGTIADLRIANEMHVVRIVTVA